MIGRLVLLTSAVIVTLASCIAVSNPSTNHESNGPVSLTNAAVGDGGVPSFYVWTNPVPDKPGTVLRLQALEEHLALQNSDPAKDLRILYTSTDGVDGKTPVTVSGAIYLPIGNPPSGGWPIIAWDHGTVGVADICAQSFRPRSPRDQAYLEVLLSRGYAVVATDYEGLGTPGPHPYMALRAEAYSTLDSVRAALATLPGVLANKVIAVGQSQGSGAAIATLQYAPAYAPDINVLGGVATGITDLFSGVNNASQIPPRAVAAGNSVYRILRLIGLAPAVEPGFDATPYVSDLALPLLRASTKACVDELHTIQASSSVTNANYLKAQLPVNLQKKMDAVMSMPIEGFALKAPLFTGTGLADTTTPPSKAYNFISTACSRGATIEWHYYPGLTHSGTVNGSLPDSLPFINKVFAGTPVTGNCSVLTIPPPLQAPTPGLPFNR